MFNLKKYGTHCLSWELHLGIARLGAFFANSFARKKTAHRI
jgi:hypothetical protein